MYTPTRSGCWIAGCWLSVESAEELSFTRSYIQLQALFPSTVTCPSVDPLSLSLLFTLFPLPYPQSDLFPHLYCSTALLLYCLHQFFVFTVPDECLASPDRGRLAGFSVAACGPRSILIFTVYLSFYFFSRHCATAWSRFRSSLIAGGVVDDFSVSYRDPPVHSLVAPLLLGFCFVVFRLLTLLLRYVTMAT